MWIATYLLRCPWTRYNRQALSIYSGSTWKILGNLRCDKAAMWNVLLCVHIETKAKGFHQSIFASYFGHLILVRGGHLLGVLLLELPLKEDFISYAHGGWSWGCGGFKINGGRIVKSSLLEESRCVSERELRWWVPESAGRDIRGQPQVIDEQIISAHIKYIISEQVFLLEIVIVGVPL